MIKVANREEVKQAAEKLLEPVLAALRSENATLKADMQILAKAHQEALQALREATTARDKEAADMQQRIAGLQQQKSSLEARMASSEQKVSAGLMRLGDIIGRQVELKADVAKLKERQDRIAKVQAQLEDKGRV